MPSKPNNLFFILLVAAMMTPGLIASYAATAMASDEEVALSPRMAEGDTFVFMRSGKREPGKFTWTVTDVSRDGGFSLVEKKDGASSPRDLFVSASFKITNSEGKEVYRTFQPDFPLYVGKKWKTRFKAHSRKTGKVVDFARSYKVLKTEKVKVPAGEFTAFRIRLSHYPVQKPDKGWRGTIWYAPSARMVVKIDTNSPARDRVELMEYAHGKQAAPVAQKAATSRKPVAARPPLKEHSGEVDANIPATDMSNPEAIAVIIGNRDYRNAKPVEFALNDARTIRKYLTTTLGYRPGNIFYLENALKSEFELLFGNAANHKGKLFNAVRPGVSEVFIYYSGHGAPGLKDNKGYFVPVEADPNYIELGGYPIDTFYANLAKLPARSVTVALDACFSGAGLFENISPMVIEVKDPALKKGNNIVVLSSSSGSQVSSWYNDRKHGMFTYFFLKAMGDAKADADSNGKLTFREIHSYISDNAYGVPYYARRLHGVDQVPSLRGNYKGRSLLER